MKNPKFLEAISSKNLVELTFLSKEKGVLTRTCAPMDYGPWRRHSSSPEPRYHFIDIDSSNGVHPLSILEEQIQELNVLSDTFEPKDFIHWTPNWHIVRDWGIYS